MPLWKIAWRSIQQRALASFLTGLSMALGVSLVVAVLVMSGVVGKSFQSSAGLGYNMIVGAKGSPLQLVFNTVYYIDKPIENIPYWYYQEFLPAAKRQDEKDGKYSHQSDLAVPICMGDYFRNFRVAGTTPAMLDELEFSPDEKYTFAEGRNFKHDEFFTGVMGATAAAETGMKVGDEFRPTHGEGGHEHSPFKLVGILNRTGTPADRAVFVNIEGFYLMEGHARPVAPNPNAAAPNADAAPANVPGNAVAGQPIPLPIDQREVTSILLRTKSPMAGAPPELFAPGLAKNINKENFAQAVLPIGVISRFFDSIIGPLTYVLFVLAVLIVVVSGIGIMVSIYNSMSERRHEIAVMRALGAARGKVMLIVLVESILLALGGGLCGWVLGHLLIGLLSPWIAGATSVSVGYFKFAPQYELILIPALIGLASLVGFLPALSAYRTDVARALTAAP
jgi:putative ABC transport system permease protein